MRSWGCIERTEAALHSLDEHIAHRLAWQPFAMLCALDQHVVVAAVLGEGGCHGLA
jgi:hypothetical protein